MKRITLTAAGLFACLAAGGAQAAQPHEAAFGLWMVQAGNAIVNIAPCGDKACGAIAWLAEPNDEAGAPKVDRHNEDPALQSRPLCGLNIIGDFSRGADGEWESGFIYDAAKGDLYKSTMHVKDDGTLYVRGYVGISLFGKSQIWTKVDDARGGC